MAGDGMEDKLAGTGGNAARAILGNAVLEGRMGTTEGAQIIDLLTHRQTTHGHFGVQAAMAQRIRGIFQDAPNWDRLSAPQKESLHMIAAKISRILCGNPQCADHWIDISGYATLAADGLERN